MLSIGDAPPTHPINPGMFFAGIYADNFVRFGLPEIQTSIPSHWILNIPGNMRHESANWERLKRWGDLGRFQARGGKLFIMPRNR